MTLLFIDFDFSPIYKADSGGSWTFSFVGLKQRPMTSRTVCYRIELAVAKTFMPG